MNNMARRRKAEQPPGNKRPDQDLPSKGHGREGHGREDCIEIFGLHAVEAVLKNPARSILECWLTQNAARKLQPEIEKRKPAFQVVQARKLDNRLGASTVHQGALALVRPLPAVTVDDICKPEDGAPHRPVVVLDKVTDPHNAGAILRSAAAFGAAAVIMTRRNSPPLGGVLAKAASGALEHVPVVLVSNLARALDQLGTHGFEIIGLEGTADTPLETLPLEPPTAFVFGAEGTGLRRLTREHCDHLARITTCGPLASLNVSNAVAIALHWAPGRARLSANGVQAEGS